MISYCKRLGKLHLVDQLEDLNSFQQEENRLKLFIDNV